MLPLRTLLVGVFTFIAAGAPALAQDIAALKLGTNLNEVTDYSPELPFRDMFLFSREWITQCRAGVDPGCTNGNAFDTGEAGELDLDENGWVKSLPAPANSAVFTSAATVWDLPPEFPGGRFVVLYTGSGTIEYGLGAAKDSGASSAGRDIVEVNIANGPILLRITATNPANHIRNIRFVRAADESAFAANRFSSPFLDQLRPYQALRFMDWMRTNNSATAGWNDRARPSDARYSTARGVPPEIMIELANTTGKTPWFTMPARATDEYLTNFAALVKNSLNANLAVFVEYSNEVWNGAFSQGEFVEQQGLAEFTGSSESAYTKRLNWHGKRTAEMCDIWKGVFGANAARVVCVMGSQAANSFTGDQSLGCPLWDEGPCVNHGINALAIAPYVGDHIGQAENYAAVSEWPNAADGGLALLFQELNEGGAIPGGPAGGGLAESFRWIDDNKTVAANRGVTLITYEGGQHLVGIGAASSDDRLTELFTSANRDARMGALYSTYLAGWQSRNAGLFMHFNDMSGYSRFGSWGALETIGQTSSPKYDALSLYGTGVIAARPKLRVSVTGRGRVFTKGGRINCGRRCSTTITSSRPVTLMAAPGSGFRLKKWRGACNHARLTCTFMVRKSRTVRAEFVRR